jgi:fumarate hydratase subunit alpha
MIKLKEVENLAYNLYLKASFSLRKDIIFSFKKAMRRETSPIAREAFKVLLKNAYIANKEKIPICQDTGFPVVFLEIGDRVKIPLFKIEKAIEKGIKKATFDGNLRKSLIYDPILRKNILANIPPIFHIESIKGNKIKITVLAKGFGSENWTKLWLLNPTTSKREIINLILDWVKKTGASACPPYIIGVGIGGTSEYAVYLSKKATIIPFNRKNKNLELSKMENEILKRVNGTKIGPLGLGGKTTAIAVKILTHPTHIAGLPLAVSLGCHATRFAKGMLK